jgi:hypothetical protein
MMTAASIKNSGDQAELTISGSKVMAKILSPRGAKFSVLTADPKRPGQDHNVGVKRLTIDVSGANTARIGVLLSPNSRVSTASLIPLSGWR